MNVLSKVVRRLLVVAVVIVVFLVLVTLSLPMLVSSGWARVRILAAVNEALPGRIEIADWRVGWLSETGLTGVRYEEPAGTLVTVSSVTVPRGLIAIARTRDLGVVSVQVPFVRVAPPLPPVSVEEPAAPPSAAVPQAPAPADEIPARFRGVPVRGVIRIAHGRIEVGDAQSAQVLLQDVNATVDASDLEQGLRWELSGTCGSAGGALSGRGTLDLNPEAMSDLLKLPLQADLTLSSLQLDPLFVLAGGLPGAPTGSGLLSAALSIKGNPLHAEGQVELRDLRLKGGALGDDQPSFERISLDFAGSYSAAGAVLERLALTSPLLNATGSGTPQAVTVRAIAQIPEWFSRLPHTLRLREGMAVKQGVIDLRASVLRGADGESFDVSAVLQGLEGVLNGKPVALDKDVQVTAKGVRRGEDLTLETLAVESGFINGTAGGSLKEFSARFMADIPGAMREIGAFIDLGAWQATGTAALTADIRRQDDAQSIVARLAVTNLFVADGDTVLITDPALEINLDAAGDLLGRREIERLSLTFASTVLRGRLQASSLKLPPGVGAYPSIGEFWWVSNVSLAELAPVLRHAKVLPEGGGLVGNVVLKANGSGEGGRVAIPSLKLDVSELVFENADLVLREPTVSLSASAALDLMRKSASLKDVELTLAEGKVTAPAMSLADWSRTVQTFSAVVKGEFDIGKLVQLVQPVAAPKKDGPRYAGMLTFDANIEATADGLRAAVGAAARNFELTAPGGQKVSEEAMRLDAEMEVDRTKQRLRIGKLQLATSPLSLDVSGDLTDMTAVKNLKLDGTVSTDMKRIEVYARQFTDMDFEIEGKAQKPFRLQVSLAGKTAKAVMASVLGEAGVHASRVQMLGLDLSNLDVPVVFSNSVSRLDLSSDWNEGRVALRPRVDWSQEQPAIRFPDNSRVMDTVLLTDGLADALLAQFNPIFKGTVVAAGSVSLALNSFYFPINDAWKQDAKFAGTLELRGVKLGSGGLLQDVLQMLNAKKQTADIGDRDITFICEDGRIRTSPLMLNIDKHTVVFSGSVGLDQTLRYEVAIPLTEDLAGRDVIKYLGTNNVVKLPIGGLVASPKIDRTNLQAELVRLGTIAAQRAAAEKLTGALFGKQEKTATGDAGDQSVQEKPKSTEDEIKQELEKKAGDLLKGLFKN